MINKKENVINANTIDCFPTIHFHVLKYHNNLYILHITLYNNTMTFAHVFFIKLTGIINASAL